MIERVKGNLQVLGGVAPEASQALEREGYCVLREVFDAAAIAALAQELDTAFAEPSLHGGRDEGEHRHAMLNRSELCQRAIATPRSSKRSSRCLGGDCHVIANTAWRNAAAFAGGPWHCDAGPHRAAARRCALGRAHPLSGLRDRHSHLSRRLPARRVGPPPSYPAATAPAVCPPPNASAIRSSLTTGGHPRFSRHAPGRRDVRVRRLASRHARRARWNGPLFPAGALRAAGYRAAVALEHRRPPTVPGSVFTCGLGARNAHSSACIRPTFMTAKRSGTLIAPAPRRREFAVHSFELADQSGPLRTLIPSPWGDPERSLRTRHPSASARAAIFFMAPPSYVLTSRINDSGTIKRGSPEPKEDQRAENFGAPCPRWGRRNSSANFGLRTLASLGSLLALACATVTYDEPFSEGGASNSGGSSAVGAAQGGSGGTSGLSGSGGQGGRNSDTNLGRGGGGNLVTTPPVGSNTPPPSGRGGSGGAPVTIPDPNSGTELLVRKLRRRLASQLRDRHRRRHGA